MAIAAFYALLQSAGITCPFLFLSGISCPGCGMTRAWLALLRLDLSSAFAWHPLFWLAVPGAAVLLLRRHIPANIFRWAVGVMAALFLAVYAVRLLIPEDTVVVFSPAHGLVWRLFARLVS